ncbi:amidohydrolase family protein [Acidobacteria bacterium AH-259-L09]|nr:amidohydrolase family protein [Acidobacteria bacterium AH-259-L09]
MHKVSILFVTIFLLPIRVVLPEDAKTRFKIDSHYHYRNSADFIEKTVKEYRKYNTMACVLTPVEAIDKIKKAIEQYPDVFIGYGSIKLDDPQALEKIDRFYAAGFKGIGELSRPLKNFHNPRYFPIYERLQLYGMAALFHTGIVSRRNPDVPQYSSMDRMRPAYVDLIARRFPRLVIHTAHLGNPWYEEAAEALRWNPNLYSDVTGSSLLKKANHPEFWGEILWWRPSLATRHSPSGGDHAFGKIVFATDEGPEGLLANIERFEKFLEANHVPEEVQEKCWSGTFAKILGVTPGK